MTRTMKDSGIEWIGEIPEDWDVVKVKRVSNLKNGKSIKDQDKKKFIKTESNTIPYIMTKDINRLDSSINHISKLFVSDKDEYFNFADKNTTLLCVEGGSAGTKNTFLNKKVAYVNKLCAFMPNEFIYGKYLYYYINSPAFINIFNSYKTGLIGGVGISSINKIPLVCPPLSEQEKIASILDEKVARIDAIIADTKQSIEELKKYKQSLITETVTKGLDKDVPMKDSGIEWIGKIPEDWEVKRIGTYFSQRMTKVSDEEFKPLSVTKKGIVLQLDTVAKSDNHENRKLVLNGDFVINSRSDRKLSSGLSYLDGSVSLINIVIFSDDVSKMYTNYLFKNIAFAEEFYRWGTGIVDDLWSTKWDKMKKILIPIPPAEEQEQIANFLDKQAQKIDQLIKDREQLVVQYEEYKKSMIYEYVTGKREI